MCDASTILVVEIRAAWRILINETHDTTRRREFFCEVNMMDLSIFLTAEAWISLGTLIFLEIVLGVDNIVFITITTDRLPKEKQALGRKLGLAGALISRIIFLSFASFLVHMVDPLFAVDLGFFSHGFSVRDIVMILGGAYLVYRELLKCLTFWACRSLKPRLLRSMLPFVNWVFLKQLAPLW